MGQQPWTEFVRATRICGKLTPSALVTQAAQPVTTVLQALVKLFRVQCKKIQVVPSTQHLYLSPALNEALKVIRSLPNTTEADVTGLLDTLLVEGPLASTGDVQRGAVRAVLHEASSAFAAESTAT